MKSGERRSSQPLIALRTEGTTRWTLCIGRYAIKIPTSLRGFVANYGERVRLLPKPDRSDIRRGKSHFRTSGWQGRPTGAAWI